MSTVGFDENVNTLLERIEERFVEKWTTDHLHQEFYQLSQGKNEKLRQFAGHLETYHCKLKREVPGQYDEGCSNTSGTR